MFVTDDAGSLTPGGAFWFFASKLAPTEAKQWPTLIRRPIPNRHP
jgi:hypothetical protein